MILRACYQARLTGCDTVARVILGRALCARRSRRRAKLSNRVLTSFDFGRDVEHPQSDRTAANYGALIRRHCGACSDNATLTPRWVGDAANVLNVISDIYTFVSSISVYVSDAEVGADETAVGDTYTAAGAMAHSARSWCQNFTLRREQLGRWRQRGRDRMAREGAEALKVPYRLNMPA